MVTCVWVTAFAPHAPCAAKPRSGHDFTRELPSSAHSPPYASGHSRSFLLSNTFSTTIQSKNPNSTSVHQISMSSSGEQCFCYPAKAAFIPITRQRHAMPLSSITCLAGFGQISTRIFHDATDPSGWQAGEKMICTALSSKCSCGGGHRFV